MLRFFRSIHQDNEPDFPDASSVLDSDTTNLVTGTIVTRNTWDIRTSFPGSGYYIQAFQMFI